MSINPRPNPYVGPRAFETGEKLYGRDRELNELSDLLVSERIVLLYSPSGAGKSSLVRAGLVPRMREENFMVLPVARVNMEPPPDSVKYPKFNRYAFSLLSSLEYGLPEDQRLPAAELADLSLDSYLNGYRSRVAVQPAGKSESDEAASQPDLEVLIIDQFEEIVTVNPTDREGKMAFFTQLGAALRNRHRWVLFAMREDFIATLDPYQRPIPTRFSNTYRLDLLSLDSALEAIQKPPQRVNVSFEGTAARSLVKDLSSVQVQRPDGSMDTQGGLYIEPVQLQVVCFRLWQGLDENDVEITAQDLERVGDVNQSLSDYYAERVSEIARETEINERRIRRWVNEKLITESGIRGQVLMGVETSEGLENKAILALEDAHLLRAEKRRGATWFELAHDRLIAPVKTDNDSWFLKNLSLLQRQAILWQNENRSDHLLLRGKTFTEADAWAKLQSEPLEPVESDFLETCRLAREEEQKQREKQAQLVKLEQEALMAGKLRYRLVFAVIAAVIAAGFAVATLFSGAQALRASAQANAASTLAVGNAAMANAASTLAVANASTAQANESAAISGAATARAASTQSALAAVEAQQAQSTAVFAKGLAEENALAAQVNYEEAQRQAARANSGQLAAQAQGYLDTRLDLAALLGVEALKAADTSQARSVLLSISQRSLQQTFDAFGFSIPRQSTDILVVAVSPDGEHVAWGSVDGSVVLYNNISRRIEWRKIEHAAEVRGLDFSPPDGRYLVSGGLDARMLLWDVQTGVSEKLVGAENGVRSVAYSPDGTLLAAAIGTQVRVWDMLTKRKIIEMRQQALNVESVAWSPDGAQLVSGGDDRQVILWDLKNPEPKTSHRLHRDAVLGVAWSPDGHVIASAGEDDTIIFWDVIENRFLGDPVEAHSGELINDLAFSSDGRVLASGGGDGDIVLTDVETRREVGRNAEAHKLAIRSIAFGGVNGGGLLATAGDDNTVILQIVKPQQPLSQEVYNLKDPIIAISPGGLDIPLAISQPAGQVSLLQLLPEKPESLLTLSGRITSATISRDGSLAALGSIDGSIRTIQSRTGQVLWLRQVQKNPVQAVALDWQSQRLASVQCVELITSRGGSPLCMNNDLTIWDASTGQQIAQLVVDETQLGQIQEAGIFGHRNIISALSFNPDGKLLAAADSDGTIILWDIERSRPFGLPLSTRMKIVSSLAFSPDGRILVSAGADRLQFWDLETQQQLGRDLSGVPGNIRSLAFQDDSHLYAGLASGVILRWEAGPPLWAKRACELANRNFTSAEWNQFFPSQRLRDTCTFNGQ